MNRCVCVPTNGYKSCFKTTAYIYITVQGDTTMIE